jgi:hypothetical protein
MFQMKLQFFKLSKQGTLLCTLFCCKREGLPLDNHETSQTLTPQKQFKKHFIIFIDFKLQQIKRQCIEN